MIPLDRQRAADRKRWEGVIAAQPLPARFRTLSLQVRVLGEPAKMLAMRAGGFDPNFTAEIILVLPYGQPLVKAEEVIEVQDLSGETRGYFISTVTALLGDGCCRCALRPRRAGPQRSAALRA